MTGSRICWSTRTPGFRRRPIRLARLAIALVGLLGGCGGVDRVATHRPSPELGTPGVSLDAAVRYVALGDSYTIGTSVAEAERWPDQVAAALPELDLVANLGVNGFTSRDVIELELPQLDALRPDVITLLIGVNDVVQGVPVEAYRRNVDRILDTLADEVGADHVLVVTTPDYTVTPAGGDYGDPATQSAGIRANNEAITEAAQARGIAVVDIYDISVRAKNDRSLVATDGLHPSGAQYAAWTERIVPALRALLASQTE